MVNFEEGEIVILNVDYQECGLIKGDKGEIFSKYESDLGVYEVLFNKNNELIQITLEYYEISKYEIMN